MGGFLELEGIWKIYGDNVVLRDVSLSIREKEFFVVMGPSGSGKTTLLKIIAGLEEPTRGVVKINNIVVNDVPPQKRNLGVLFQKPALFPHMNVYENIAFGLRIRRWSKQDIDKRVREVMELVRLDPSKYLNRNPEELSGGEQQRVALARALAPDPDVILLDEPLSHLDYNLRKDMITELKRLQRTLGKTFFYITHDQWEGMALADRIAVIYRGVIQQIGSPREIYEKPINRFVASFIGDNNILQAEIREEEIYIDPLRYSLKISGNTPKNDSKKIYVAFRPEKISIKKINGAGENLCGEIIDEIYMGFYSYLKIKINSTELLVRSDDKNLAIGEKICIELPKDFVVLEE